MALSTGHVTVNLIDAREFRLACREVAVACREIAVARRERKANRLEPELAARQARLDERARAIDDQEDRLRSWDQLRALRERLHEHEETLERRAARLAHREHDEQLAAAALSARAEKLDRRDAELAEREANPPVTVVNTFATGLPAPQLDRMAFEQRRATSTTSTEPCLVVARTREDAETWLRERGLSLSAPRPHRVVVTMDRPQLTGLLASNYELVLLPFWYRGRWAGAVIEQLRAARANQRSTPASWDEIWRPWSRRAAAAAAVGGVGGTPLGGDSAP